MADKSERPMTFKLAGWWGFIFSSIFLIYGGVQIVLGILDNNYKDLNQSIIFALLGIILIAFCFAYVELRRWGWYGLIAVNGLTVLMAIWKINIFESIFLLAIAVGALIALLAPATRRYLLQGR
jgi:hypothetical protein